MLHKTTKHRGLPPGRQERWGDLNVWVSHPWLDTWPCHLTQIDLPRGSKRDHHPLPIDGMLSPFSHVQLFSTPWTVARQAPLSMGFSRQEYWSGLPCPIPEDLSSPRVCRVSCIGRWIVYHCATWEALPSLGQVQQRASGPGSGGDADSRGQLCNSEHKRGQGQTVPGAAQTKAPFISPEVRFSTSVG